MIRVREGKQASNRYIDIELRLRALSNEDVLIKGEFYIVLSLVPGILVGNKILRSYSVEI